MLDRIAKGLPIIARMIEKIAKTTEDAFAELFAKDAKLFAKVVHEQTIMFRLGLYLQHRFAPLCVDCEYRNGSTTVQISI